MPPVLELTYNWDVDNYEIGTGYGHVALEVDDATPPAPRSSAGVVW